jgi:ubiquinone/menaquinone biosynthesis C-methylase UbiE
MSVSGRKHGRWDQDEFFSTGDQDVAGLMIEIERLGYPVCRETALDFGCGVGRLTRALAKHFQQCCGVDISESMISKAQELNSHLPQCKFIVNNEDHLRVFPDESFDLIYTKYVLQHLPNKRLIKGYISELFRTLRRSGLLVFQVRTALSLKTRLQLGARLYSLMKAIGASEGFIYRRLELSPIRMTTISEREIRAIISAARGRILDVRNYSATNGKGQIYFVTK